MKGNMLVRFGVGVIILAAVLAAAYTLGKPGSQVASRTITRDEARNVSAAEEPAPVTWNAQEYENNWDGKLDLPAPVTSSKEAYSEHFASGAEPAEAVIPVTGNFGQGDKTVDLGAGYTLVITGSEGRIIPPSSGVKKAGSLPKTIDLGAGYVLELNDTGGKIIPPPHTVKDFGSPPAAEDGPIYLQGGFWLEKGADGSWIMHR